MSTANDPRSAEKQDIAKVLDVCKSPEDAKQLMDIGYRVITPNSGSLSVKTFIGKGFTQDYLDVQLHKRLELREEAALAQEVLEEARRAELIRRNAEAQAKKDAAAQVKVPTAAATLPVLVDPSTVGKTTLGIFSMNGVQYKMKGDILRVFNDDGHPHPDSPAYVTSKNEVVVMMTIVNGVQTYPYILTKNSTMYTCVKNYVRVTYPYVPPPATPVQQGSGASQVRLQVEDVDDSDESSVSGHRVLFRPILETGRQHDLKRRFHRRLKDMKRSGSEVERNASTLYGKIDKWMKEPNHCDLTLFEAFREYIRPNLGKCRYRQRVQVWHETSFLLQINKNQYWSQTQIKTLARLCAGLNVADSDGMFASETNYPLA